MHRAQFGNRLDKIARYRRFWRRESVTRPLIGFTQVGWFPLQEFGACRSWSVGDVVTPRMIDPPAFMADHLRLLEEGERFDDDIIRGSGPTQVAVPFLPGMLGCALRVLPGSLLGEERRLEWPHLDAAIAAALAPDNPWLLKYLEFADALAVTAAGRFPVSHGAEIGPTDMHGSLRSHNDALMDLLDEPERVKELMARLGDLFGQLTEVLWQRLPLFEGGYFDGQYSLWAPGPIARLQEDATAGYSPQLYRQLVQPVDRALAGRFACSFMHLHSTSLFLLDAMLEIEELTCFEVNNDVSGPPLTVLIPFFQRIQQAHRALVIRGSFSREELRQLVGALDPRGLFLLIMVRDVAEVELLRPLVGL